MKKIITLSALAFFSASANAQSVTFLNLLSIYRGTLSPENAFDGAQKLEMLSAESPAESRMTSYILDKGQSTEKIITIGGGFPEVSGRFIPEVTCISKDSVTIATLQTQILNANFKLDAKRELEGMSSWTYTKDSITVWVNKPNNRNYMVKLYKTIKP